MITISLKPSLKDIYAELITAADRVTVKKGCRKQLTTRKQK